MQTLSQQLSELPTQIADALKDQFLPRTGTMLAVIEGELDGVPAEMAGTMEYEGLDNSRQ